MASVQEPPGAVYRHTIHLDMEDLKRLGIEDMPIAGTEFHVEAVGVVCHSSTHDHDADGDVDGVCVTLQVTDMGVMFGEAPELADTDGDAAHRLYGG
jgi:hypothetical protein